MVEDSRLDLNGEIVDVEPGTCGRATSDRCANVCEHVHSYYQERLWPETGSTNWKKLAPLVFSSLERAII